MKWGIASTRAFMSEPDSEAYAASKGGILALTHALISRIKENGKMGNKQKKTQRQPHRPANDDQPKGDKPVTLKDLLGASTVAKLKEQAETMKQEEAALRQRARQEAEAAREAEQKLKEKDFEYLLNNSSQDWKKFK